MGLETGTYIDSLVVTNPLGTDAKSAGDDHLRLIKSTLKATFPNITGAVTPTHTELNYLDGVTSPIQTQLDAAQTELDTAQTELDTKQPLNPTLTAIAAGNVSSAWPVGSVYTSIVATNPATLLGGGTWVAFGAGRVLVGLDAGQTEFDTVEETGGAKTHTLTTAEMPAHTHSTNIYDQNGSASVEGVKNHVLGGSLITTSSTGGGGAHNNLQPYIVVYFWKRTA